MLPSTRLDRRARVLTWHVHGSYLASLAACGHEIYLPVGRGDDEGYLGRTDSFDWPDNVIEVDAADVPNRDFDVILCQSRRNYERDRLEILSPAQLRLPLVYLEHDPPREHPTDTRHPVDDPSALLVHVTHFNRLMWDSGRTPTIVIEHGVTRPPGIRYTGELERGIVVVNGLNWRGRRLGQDVFLEARRHVPLDLVGMHSAELGGLGEVPPRELPALVAQYRFFFHPVRYTSLGLALLEAMAIGLPVVGLATTEVVEAVDDRVSGFLSTDPQHLVPAMQRLLDDPMLAHRMGQAARVRAEERYGIERFAREWRRLLSSVATRGVVDVRTQEEVPA